MLNSFINFIGTPVAPTTPGANITIATSTNHSLDRRNSASNSTTLDFDGVAETSSHIISSPSVSPVKEIRENSMSSSYSSASSIVSEENLSLKLKHGIDEVNLDNPSFQTFAIRYLLEKVRDHEELLIQTVKDNKGLREEISELYKLNDVLAAENVTLQESMRNNKGLMNEISSLKDTFSTEKKVLVSSLNDLKKEIESMKEAFISESDQLRYAFMKNSRDMKNEFGEVVEDIVRLCGDVDYLDEHLKETQLKSCHNQIQIEGLKDSIVAYSDTLRNHIEKELNRMERTVTSTNQYNRRENLVIDGIPDHISQEDLENVCLDIVHQVGFWPVENYDVVGCHRLRKTVKDLTTPVIIRFVNRKVHLFF